MPPEPCWRVTARSSWADWSTGFPRHGTGCGPSRASPVLEGPRVDPTKLTLVLPGTGADGVAVERDLLIRGLPVEMADRDTIVAMVTIADDVRASIGWSSASSTRSSSRRGPPRPVTTAAAWSVDPVTVTSPREAFFGGHVTVSANDAVGRTCAELIAPYPPVSRSLRPANASLRMRWPPCVRRRPTAPGCAYAADPSARDDQGAALRPQDLWAHQQREPAQRHTTSFLEDP